MKTTLFIERNSKVLEQNYRRYKKITDNELNYPIWLVEKAKAEKSKIIDMYCALNGISEMEAIDLLWGDGKEELIL